MSSNMIIISTRVSLGHVISLDLSRHVPIFHGKSYIPSFLYAQQAALEEILYQFEEKLQAEREEAARKQEELQAQLQAQQAALEENQSLLRQTQEEVKGMHTCYELS